MDPIIYTIITAICSLAAAIAAIYSYTVTRNIGKQLMEQNDRLFEKNERSIREAVDSIIRSQNEAFKSLREEISNTINNFGTGISNQITSMTTLQQGQLEEFAKRINNLSDKNESRLEQMRQTIEVRIKDMQNDNSIRLENMRQMVDEHLSVKLQKRLNDSFVLVSDRLEQVYKGLGEMQTLASGVGDLKKVLTNVKTRGTWGEYQLGQLLEQMLSPSQYESNVPIPANGKERVEFAIKMPGKGDESIYLPIDSKFPQEDYLRLVDASDEGDAEAIRTIIKQLEASVKSCAKQIRDKYIKPPYTTNFAIMFLPVEGLYAEVLRIPGLAEQLQREYRVVPSGPTTLAALLNSLQMGFKTLAIEKRSNEVWKLLGAFKTDFFKFTQLIAKTKKKLDEASNSMGDMEKRTSIIQRKLRSVEEIDETEQKELINADEDIILEDII